MESKIISGKAGLDFESHSEAVQLLTSPTWGNMESKIISGKAGLDFESHSEAVQLLTAWDFGKTGETLTLDYAKRGRFILWTQRPGYINQLVYMGTRAAAFAYIRGMIHGKRGLINL
jgi:hypothetical protein